MSEVRGSGQEYQTATVQEQPRGATQRRSQGRRLEELPRVRGQGRRPGGDIPCPKTKARGDGREELPHAPKPEAKGGGRAGGATPRPHARSQGRWPGGPTPHPRSHGCAGTVGPRGAIPH